MDAQEFRSFGKAAIDLVADYIENIRERDVLPSVEPGYLQQLIPDSVPVKGEAWQDLLKDVENIILPGITHWHSPNFHAYYPTGNSYPSVVAETIAAGLSVIGFNWMASPACTELEVAVMNWMGKLLGLPEEFLNCSEGPGGGVIQQTASEATLIALLAARNKFVKEYHEKLTEADVKSKLIAYSSDQSNSSIEKAGLIGSMKMRLLECNESGQLSGKSLKEAVEKDLALGNIPCFVVGTLGTTPTCAFDDLYDIGLVCRQYGLWLHVDAAYAGSALICPEYRYLLKGIEFAESFNFNPHKWLMVNFDCSALWVKDAEYLVEAFNVQRIYLKHKYMGQAPDYIHWQLGLGRKFRSLKLWFVLRIYGVEGLQKHIRDQIDLAKHFESLLRKDDRFEIYCSRMGLVCFHMKMGNDKTKELHDLILAQKKIFMVPCTIKGTYLLRFVICARTTEAKDVDFAWNHILSIVEEILPPIQPIVNVKTHSKDQTVQGLQINYKTNNVNLIERTK